jgi:hypothetical protein
VRASDEAVKQQSIVESLESASLEVFYRVADWDSKPDMFVWGTDLFVPCYLPVDPLFHELMQFAIKILAIS